MQRRTLDSEKRDSSEERGDNVGDKGGDKGLNQINQELAPEQAQIVKALWQSIAVVSVVLIAGAFALVAWFSALSVTIGALSAVVNFAIMSRVVKKAILSGEREGMMMRVLAKYYIRFAATAAFLWLLIAQGWADPIGLLVGLSTVVLSLTIWGLIQAHRIWG
jgi:hypothetical protein